MDTGRTQGLAETGKTHDCEYACQLREGSVCGMLANFKPDYLTSRNRIRPFVLFLFHVNAICICACL